MQCDSVKKIRQWYRGCRNGYNARPGKKKKVKLEEMHTDMLLNKE